MHRYFVFADPKGPKIGNGGATLHVLEQLEQKISEDDLSKGILYLFVHKFSVLVEFNFKFVYFRNTH